MNTTSSSSVVAQLARDIGVVEATIDQLVIDDDDELRGVQMRDGCVIPVGAVVTVVAAVIPTR